MFKQNFGIQSLLMQLEEKQLHLLDTVKRMANIRMLRRALLTYSMVQSPY